MVSTMDFINIKLNKFTLIKKTYLFIIFFSQKNGTEDKRIKVKRGIRNSMDMNRVIEYMNNTKFDVWSEEKCNKLGGTEGTKFPPLITEGQAMSVFTPILCR